MSDCADTRALAGALRALGAGIEEEEAPGSLRIQGWGGPPRARGVRVDVGAAGASLRFLLPVLAAGDTEVLLTGHPRLWRRPHDPLLALLRSLGTELEEHRDPVRPGFRIRGRGLPGGCWEAPARESSQFLSGLLLAAGLAAGPVHLRVRGPLPSAGYVDLTLEALRSFRGPEAVEPAADGFLVRPGLPAPRELEVPGDPSGATFFLVAGILAGVRQRLRPAWSSLHPEAGLHHHLFAAGLLVAEGGGVAATGSFPGECLDLDLDPAPDAGPALAVLGAWLPAGARLRRVGRLRWKESDRVAGCLRLLAALGCPGRLEGEDLVVPGGGFQAPAGAARLPFDPDGDHRLAMAAGVASLVAPWLEVTDPDCVAKSFPDFWRQLGTWREAVA